MSDVIEYNITIHKGSDYTIDFLTEEDDGTAIDVSGFTAEAQLREYPESNEYLDFTCTADATGFHLAMGHEDSAKIGYTRGYYDLFLSADGNRDKFAQGKATVIPEVSR